MITHKRAPGDQAGPELAKRPARGPERERASAQVTDCDEHTHSSVCLQASVMSVCLSLCVCLSHTHTDPYCLANHPGPWVFCTKATPGRGPRP